MLRTCSRIWSRHSACCKRAMLTSGMNAQATDTTPSHNHSFALTDEQEQLRKEIRDFAAREIAPNVLRWDEASEFPHDVVRQLGQMGLLGVIFPPEYGGGGPRYTHYTLPPQKRSPPPGAPRNTEPRTKLH